MSDSGLVSRSSHTPRTTAWSGRRFARTRTPSASLSNGPLIALEHRLDHESEFIRVAQRRLGRDELLLEGRQLERLVDVDHARHGDRRSRRGDDRTAERVTHQVDAARRVVIEMARRVDHRDHVAGHRREVVRRSAAGSAVTTQVERYHLDRRIEGEQPLDHRVERDGGLGDAVDEHHGRSRTLAAPRDRRAVGRGGGVVVAHPPTMPDASRVASPPGPSPITNERASASTERRL